jgi:hypothetical protein
MTQKPSAMRPDNPEGWVSMSRKEIERLSNSELVEYLAWTMRALRRALADLRAVGGGERGGRP